MSELQQPEIKKYRRKVSDEQGERVEVAIIDMEVK
jgi:hypothetical protein